jgi:hypothetical protein
MYDFIMVCGWLDEDGELKSSIVLVRCEGGESIGRVDRCHSLLVCSYGYVYECFEI